MELGLNFDSDSETEDSAEKQSNAKQKRQLSDYKPRIVADGWFNNRDALQQELEEPKQSDSGMSVLKMRADLHYFQTEYREALDDYKAALDLVPLNNTAVRKDITESIARSFAMLQCHKEAASLAHKLLDLCTNDDQLLASYNLLLDIYSTWPPPIDQATLSSYRFALQNCLLLNPLCDRLWRDLASVYSQTADSQRGAACRLTAQYIRTVQLVQEANSHPSDPQQTALAAKSLALVSFHGNYRNLPYANRLSETFNYQEAESRFDRKLLSDPGNESLFDSIYFSGHNGALLTQLSQPSQSDQTTE